MSPRKIKALFAVLCLAALLAQTPASSAQRGITQRLRFARGSSTAAVEDSVVRGTRNRYLLGARAGQTMIVRISSLEDNAVFDVYAARGRKRLTTERTEWGGELPASGDYVISVGGTRGNASYRLEVEIH
ncbi:MAG: hypothetical protein WKF74_06815 [Pyrinomonadaceae bacterium]